QSLDRDQSIFAMHNVTKNEVRVPVLSINLIGGDVWLDLLSNESIRADGGDIVFKPYQCRWVSNRV
ncbi:MAG: alpha-amylase, partial [Pseudomonadota bacterium]